MSCRFIPRVVVPVLAVVLLGTAACVDCQHFESRWASVSVRLSPPGAEIEQYFGLSVEEYREPGFRAVRVSVSGSNLRWHVRGIRLFESTGEGRVLFDFLLDTPGPEPDAAGGGHASDEDLQAGTWEEFLVRLETHGVKAELTTDVPGQERLILLINVPNATEWVRSECPTD